MVMHFCAHLIDKVEFRWMNFRKPPQNTELEMLELGLESRFFWL